MVSPADLPHVRPVKPLLFPASDPEWEMGQSVMHKLLCDLLYHVLRGAVGDEHTVGCDNFVYFRTTDPSRKCAPDAFVKLDVKHGFFDSWKIWERHRGTPELCVEILSPSDTKEKLTWEEKIERYLDLGTPELIAFNVDAPLGHRLRAWDRIDDDLVERVVEGERTPCITLGLHWVIVASTAPSGEELPAALRLARDPFGADVIATISEADRAVASARATAADAEIARLRALLGSSG